MAKTFNTFSWEKQNLLKIDILFVNCIVKKIIEWKTMNYNRETMENKSHGFNPKMIEKEKSYL